MKKLIAFLALTLAGIITRADVRLPEYGQVAAISNTVDTIAADYARRTDIPAAPVIPTDYAKEATLTNAAAGIVAALPADYATTAQLTAAALDIAAVKGLVIGGEGASPYLGGIRCTINTGTGAFVPQGSEYYKALAGAYISVQLPNEQYRVPIESLEAGYVRQIFIPCLDFVDVTVQLHLGGESRFIYNEGPKIVHVHQGELADVSLNSLEPANPTSELASQLRMVGRAQFYDPDNTYGKRTSGESFPVQRVWDPIEEAWTTQFGYYSNSVWVTECDIYNLIPQLASEGGVSNLDEVGDLSASYEAAAFPWCETKRVAFVFDDDFLHTGGQATPATNVFYFARCPIYAYKETIETLAITNYNANGTVASVTECPLQIKWVARPEIMSYDNTFYIPPWEKIYARDYDDLTDTWTTREIGTKEANYYACYKSSPTSAKDGNWRMAGSNNYTIQSYPWPYRDGSNYGVYGISRGDLHTRAQKLNPYGFTVYDLNGTALDDPIAYFPPATNHVDMAARRWTGNNWHDYEAFRVLAYIQFSANAQSTASFVAPDNKIHPVGIYGHNTTGVAQTRQDALETYYASQPNLKTFVIAPATSNGYPFSWLGILNFWGSEGDQMVDVTTIAETDADGTKSIWYVANLDHSRLKPNSSGTATEYSIFTTNGYERLTYYWAYTGLSGTYYRGKDQKAAYAAFGLVATTPVNPTDIFNYNLNSSAYDGTYAPSSYPAQPSSGINLSYWMCSLSNYRNDALGPWSVYSSVGPSFALGHNWGGRASPNLLATEREARSGGTE